MEYIIDIETNGFLAETTRIHTIVLQNIKTNRLLSFAHDSRFLSIDEGLSMVEDATLLVGHNILCFDLPVIEKLYGIKANARKFDTLNASRLIWPNIADIDATRRDFPSYLTGRHSLESWGHRLKCLKGDFGKQNGWEEWSMPMQKYCERDVLVTRKLYDLCMSKEYAQEAYDIEMRFQEIIHQQEQNGVTFNKLEAQRMYYKLKKDQNEFRRKIREMIPDRKIETIFVPKRDNKTAGYVKGVPFTKVHYKTFNPGSRQQIGHFFIQKYGWEPQEKTPSGQAKCSAGIIEKLDYAEAPLIADYLACSKLLGQLGDGDKAWLKLEKDGKIHGGMITNGAITGRATHCFPNLAQIPRVGSYMGKECRALFTSSSGKNMVGADASGLELRMLAHYLHEYDHGAYAQILLESDIHTHNQKAADIATREGAKRFIYALLYGAGDAKLGGVINPGASIENKERIGSLARLKFYREIPAMERLTTSVKVVAEQRRWLKGLDGRKLYVREDYRALNTLLQGAGAIVMKKANIIFWDLLESEGITGVHQVLNVHDEFQVESLPEYSKRVGELMVKAIVRAGEYFKLHCPLDGEYKIGNNWSETH